MKNNIVSGVNVRTAMMAKKVTTSVRKYITIKMLEDYLSRNISKFIGKKSKSIDNSYSFDLMERMIRVEEEIKRQNSQIKLLIHQMDKRFESMQLNMDKRFEQVDSRFMDMQKYMDKRFSSLQWFMGLGFSIIAILIGGLKFLKI